MSDQELAYELNLMFGRNRYSDEQRTLLGEIAQAQQRLTEAIELGYPPDLSLMRADLKQLAERGIQIGLLSGQILAGILVGWSVQFKSEPEFELVQLREKFKRKR